MQYSIGDVVIYKHIKYIIVDLIKHRTQYNYLNSTIYYLIEFDKIKINEFKLPNSEILVSCNDLYLSESDLKSIKIKDVDVSCTFEKVDSSFVVDKETRYKIKNQHDKMD